MGNSDATFDKRLVELQSLFELSKTLNSSLNLKTILDTLLFTPMGRMMITQGAVLLKNNQEYQFTIAALKGLASKNIHTNVSIPQQIHAPVLLDEISHFDILAYLQGLGLKLLCPILSNNKAIGYILLGGKITRQDFTEDELEYLASFANLAAPSIENSKYIRELQNVNDELDRKVQHLKTIFEIGKELNTTFDQDKIASILVFAIMGEMMTQKIAVVECSKPEKPHFLISKGFNEREDITTHIFKKTYQILKKQQRALRLNEIENNSIVNQFQKVGVRVLVPMFRQDELAGCILIGERLNKAEYRADELEFLSTLGNAAMISLENARLFKETLEKQRLEEELSIARDIQRKLLPASPPLIDGYEFAGMNNSHSQVGGDYFDFIQINDHQWAVTIADVSGKGVPAALLMANIQASLHAMIHTEWTLGEKVARINNIIHANTNMDKFITFFVAIVDTQKHELTYVNAGHNPPMLFSGDKNAEKVKLLECGGLILGMLKNVPYEQETIALHRGDLVILFTDGVSEAMNENDEEFEEFRIEATIREHVHKSASEIMHYLEDAVKKFSGSTPQSDDITILTMRFKDSNA
ncbi:MAG: hypothetical protein DWQ10_14810 [Calditrichaeota bacterium]|nr:MAG: hypothetical protein DWQ10_14810 [Calditrichota bacterium]